MPLHRLLFESTERLERTVAPFSAVRFYWILIAVTPLVITVGVIGTVYTITGGEGLPGVPQFATLVYGVANVIVGLGTYLRLREDTWLAGALFRPPARAELSAVFWLRSPESSSGGH